MIVFPHQFASVWAAKVSQKARRPTIRWCRCTHPEEKPTCRSWAIYNIGNVWGWKLIQHRFISDVVGHGRKNVKWLRLNMLRKHKIQWCMLMINPLTSCRKSSHPSTSASSNREKFLTARSQSNGVENSKIGYNPKPPYLLRKMMTFHVNWGGSFLHKQTCNNLMAGYELLAKVLAKTEYNMYIL